MNCVKSLNGLITKCPPKDRYGVDNGYLRGLRALRVYFMRIWKQAMEGERGEKDINMFGWGTEEIRMDDDGDVST